MMVLDRISQFDPVTPAAAERVPELRDRLQRRDDQELADAGEHQRGQRIQI
jgi:hypothetical protein